MSHFPDIRIVNGLSAPVHQAESSDSRRRSSRIATDHQHRRHFSTFAPLTKIYHRCSKYRRPELLHVGNRQKADVENLRGTSSDLPLGGLFWKGR